MPVAWCLANPSQGERQVAEGLLDRAARQGVLRPGMVTLADKGLAGRGFETLVGELGATLARPDRADEPYRFGSLGGVRQWVEAIFDTLKDQLGLERHGAHTPQRPLDPGRAAAVGPGRRGLVQLAARRAHQAVPGRLRPLNPTNQSTSVI
jgi:hypothetical protein